MPRSPAGEPLRIVMADDSYLVREGARRLLEDSGDVVKVSIATGRVTSVLGSVPRGLIRFRGDFLAVDPTGRYALVWMIGNVTKSRVPLHGWAHGAYHQLAPAPACWQPEIDWRN